MDADRAAEVAGVDAREEVAAAVREHAARLKAAEARGFWTKRDIADIRAGLAAIETVLRDVEQKATATTAEPDATDTPEER